MELYAPKSGQGIPSNNEYYYCDREEDAVKAWFRARIEHRVTIELKNGGLL